MFSLIVTLIAVALVVALAVVGMYYGGTTLEKKAADAKATALVNETNQIRGAITFFYSDHGRLPTSLEELTENNTYLSGVPRNWLNGNAEFQNTGEDLSEDACLIFNKKQNIPFVPTCDDEVYAKAIVCCRRTTVN